jgi:sterol desaturase/sphingolipid hydroxylase (fatty acid hydroxylase superfamily)
MEQFLASHEVSITSWAMASAFVLIGIGETLHPRKDLGKPTPRRWAANGLLAITHIAVNALYPLGGVLVAVLALKNPYGLLNHPIVPFALRFVLAVILVDLVRYGTHYLFHRIPFLWRIHQVHHSDPDFDLTTGVRTHPGEVFLVQGVNLLAVALLAPPPVAVIALGVGTAMQNFFSHANLRLPGWVDAGLGWFMVTPDLHRIHHSDDFAEQNTNFGVLVPWWDKLFGTYLAAPALGHEKMGVGLLGFKDGRSMNVLHLLAMPFRNPLSADSRPPEPEKAALPVTSAR